MRAATFLILLFWSQALLAQQQATLSQYMFNEFVINPAYAGTHEMLSASAHIRFQNVGLEGAPNSMSFSLHSPLHDEKAAVGIMVLRDKVGVISQQNVSGAFAYRIKFGNAATLSMGLQGGLVFYDADYSQLIVDPSDPVFSQNSRSVRPNFGAGAYYYTSSFYAGISIPHLANNVFSRKNTFESISQNNPILLTGGYTFSISRKMTVKPNALLKFVEGKPVEFDLNGIVSFDEVLWAGLSIKSLNAIVLISELQLTSQLRFGYTYALTSNKLRLVEGGTHEILLNYRFAFPKFGLTNPRDF